MDELKALAELIKETAENIGLNYCSLGFIDGSVNVCTSKSSNEVKESYFLDEYGKFRKIY